MKNGSPERRLAAIVAIDVVGYSRLMGADEAGTLSVLKAHQDTLTPMVREHGGRVVSTAGDGFLLEFPSVVEALECSIDIQAVMAERNADIPDEQKMLLRIGVNLGDIIIHTDNDVFGDGVNVAARIEQLAPPGGICLSRTVRDHVGERIDVGFEDMGEIAVKNIAQPISVFRVLKDGEVAAPRPKIRPAWQKYTAMAALVVALIAGGVGWSWQLWLTRVELASIDKLAFKLPEKPSIAVLPFDDLSTNNKQEYFADGITEDIITSLSKIPDMFVIAYNSTITYKGKPVKVQQVAEDLGVRFVLEGSVQRDGDQVRVTAQLIDAFSGRHLWADRYDRDFKNVFALQDDISKNVVTALEVKLTAGEQARVWRRSTENSAAYELFLRARSMQRQDRITKSVNAEARELYEKALALDPNFTAAWIGMANIHQIDARFGFSKDPAQSLSLFNDAAQKALTIDDTLSDGYMMLAGVNLLRRQYDQVIENCEKALSLVPTDFAMAQCARNWALVGRPEEALVLITQAMRRNPYFGSEYFYPLGNAHRMLGNYDKAIAAMEAWRDLEPNFFSPLIMLSATYAEAGSIEKARATMKELLKLLPAFSIKKYPRRVLRYKDPADIERVINNLRKAGAPE